MTLLITPTMTINELATAAAAEGKCLAPTHRGGLHIVTRIERVIEIIAMNIELDRAARLRAERHSNFDRRPFGNRTRVHIHGRRP